MLELLLAYTELYKLEKGSPPGRESPAPGHMTLVSIPSQLGAFVQCANCTTVHDCTLRRESGTSIMPLDWKISWRIRSWAEFKGNRPLLGMADRRKWVVYSEGKTVKTCWILAPEAFTPTAGLMKAPCCSRNHPDCREKGKQELRT